MMFLMRASIGSDSGSGARPKNKASRVLGRDGRTLHNIIEDAIVKIRTVKNMCGHGEALVMGAASDAARDISYRQGLLSSNNLWTLELELPDFKVLAMSEALKEWSSKQSRGADGLCSQAWGFLCELAHPDDEFALRKTVADQKLCGTRISLRLLQRSGAHDADLVRKEKTGKRAAGKDACRGKSDKKDGASYLKVDMLLAGIASGTQRMVLVSPKVSEAAQTVYAPDGPASLELQQQRWQKREQRQQQRVQANELILQQKERDHQNLHKDKTVDGGEVKTGKDADTSNAGCAFKADPGGTAAALLAGQVSAAEAAVAAAKLMDGQHMPVAGAAKAGGVVGGANEAAAAAAAAAAGPCLANLKALLNISAGGDQAAQAAGLEGNSALAPLLALHFSQQLQQQAALGEEGAQQQQQQAPVAGQTANPLATAEHWQVAAGGAVTPGMLPPNNENLIQYLSAFAALSAQNGNAAGAVGAWAGPELAAALAASVGAAAAAAGDAKAAAAQGGAPLGGIKGGAAKAAAKAKKGKKSSVSVSGCACVWMWNVSLRVWGGGRAGTGGSDRTRG